VRLKSIGYTDGSGNNILNFGFSYTTNAQVQALVSQVGTNPSTTATYGYDPAGQLTSALAQTTSTGQNIRSYSFVYDSAGNRIGQTIDATVASYQYNELNQLTARRIWRCLHNVTNG
jgi:YD repeat-containing protein